MIHHIILDDIKKISKNFGNKSQQFSGKTILITGGSGFIGTYILYTFWYLNTYILKKKCSIYSVDNNITRAQKTDKVLINDKFFTFIKHDVRIPFVYPNHLDYIIHAAGIAAPVYYMKYPLETLEVATIGTRNMLDLAVKKHVRSFLFFSSSEIYGDPDPNFIPTPESYPGNVSTTGPRACYDESKRLGETMCLIYRKLYTVPVKIVRPFNIYGPGMGIDDYRVIPSYMTSAIKKKSLPVHMGGNQTRTFCYISDAIDGFLRILISNRNGQVFNLGNDTPEVNMMHLARMISDLFPNKIRISTIHYPKHYPSEGPKRRCPDISKIKTDLKYEPQVDLKTGLKRTLLWYRSINVN